MSRLVITTLMIALLNGVAVGQTRGGSISGIVTDASGALVPRADVTITNRNTGVVDRAQTNDAGVYTVLFLLPGSYHVRLQAAGFKAKEIRDALLETDQKLRLDVTLEIGSVADTIEVRATTAPLQQETAEISTTVGSAEVLSLPIATRHPYNMLMLSPGVVAANGPPSDRGYSGGVSVNGSRHHGVNLMLDGAPAYNNDGEGERIGSIEAIHEVKILASTYSAEFGRTPGATVNMHVKSGTAQFHGSVFEYNRNSALYANNWQNNANQIAKPALNMHQFGATIGGPVKLPGVREKLFFFTSYEGLATRSPVTRTRTIPDAKLRSGNFSGLPGVVNDPLAGTPFPNNTLPDSRMDSAAVKFLQLFPEPNAPGSFNANFGISANNWVRGTSATSPRHWSLSRLDYSTAKSKVFFTFGYGDEDRSDGLDFSNVLNTIRSSSRREMKRGTLGYTRFITPALANELQVYVQRDPRIEEPLVPDYDVTAQLGIQRKVGATMPTISMSGFGSFAASPRTPSVNQPAGLSETFTYLRQRHNIKAGFQYFQLQYAYAGSSNTSGSYSFNGEITGLGAAGRDRPVNAMADLLLGAVKSASYNLPQPPVALFLHNFAFFVNDDWKLTNRLTLNLGLRYEFEPWPIVKNDVYSRIDLQTGDMLVAGRNASRNLNMPNDYLNFSPRLGIAYTVTPKTVLRSGFGMFYASRNIDTAAWTFPGWSGSTTFPDPGVGRAQAFTLSQGFPVAGAEQVSDPLQRFAAASVQQPLAVSSPTFSPNDRLPYSLQWNFGIQRAIGFDTVADVSYVGSRNVRMARNVGANSPTLDRAREVVIDRVPLQQVRPYPKLSGFSALQFDTTGSYHSAQVNARRRFTSGLSLELNYTFSKNIDNGVRAGSYQIPWQFLNIEKSVSSLDRTHVFNFAWVADLPFGKGRRLFGHNRVLSVLLGGIQVTGAVAAGSGLPLTITQNNTNLVLSAQRPDVIDAANLSGRVAESTHSGAALRWLIPTNDPTFPFRRSGNLGIGNLGRNTARAPEYFNVNLGAFRDIPITERLKLAIRVEAYNAFNNVMYGGPATNIDSVSYGLITSAFASRVVQIGGRLTF